MGRAPYSGVHEKRSLSFNYRKSDILGQFWKQISFSLAHIRVSIAALSSRRGIVIGIQRMSVVSLKFQLGSFLLFFTGLMRRWWSPSTLRLPV